MINLTIQEIGLTITALRHQRKLKEKAIKSLVQRYGDNVNKDVITRKQRQAEIMQDVINKLDSVYETLRQEIEK